MFKGGLKVQKAYLILENGTVFEGNSFGASGEAVGEIVFTTAMTGYLETLTDPSYYGQIVVQTFPLIGNYGVIPEDFESVRPQVKGYIVRQWCQEPSNFRCEGDLDIFLRKNGIVGLYGIDTRHLTRVGQLVGTIASERLGVPFGIVDLSLAPTPAVGDSVAHILEEIGLEKCGTHGTTACLAMLNDAVKKGGVMACSRIGGLSGAFIPVSEDAGMIAAAKSGALCIEKLEAMTAVCSVGLDMIVVPGDTPADTLSAIIADEAAIGMVNCKTTAVRVIPAIGKDVGEELDWGGLFGCGPVMPLKKESASKFINRGGQIPAPLHSLKN